MHTHTLTDALKHTHTYMHKEKMAEAQTQCNMVTAEVRANAKQSDTDGHQVKSSAQNC